MLHEKPDELSNWKNKLDALEQLPEEAPYDKSAAWQKLQNRLDKKPVVKLKSWYWIAAACLLLLAGSTWVKRDAVEHHNARVHPEEIPETSLIVETPKVDPSLSVTPRKTAESKETFTMQVKTNPEKIITVLQVQPDTPALTQNETPPVVHEEATIVISSDTMQPATMISVKRKLRVVHINELDKPAPIPDHFALNITAPALRQNRSQQDVFHGLEFSRNASDNLLKIKLPPSN